MSSYVIKLLATGTIAEHADDMSKFAQMDAWETACLVAGKDNTPFPAPPDFLEAFSLEF